MKILKIQHLFGLLFSLTITMVHAQILQPARWTNSVSKDTVAVGEEVELIFRAVIDKSWYLYSSDFDPDLGPMVTEFSFEKNNSFSLVGGIVPVNPQKKYDDVWKGEVTYFKGMGEFRQKVKILDENPVIKGNYSYQVCSDIDGKCIPDDVDFAISISTYPINPGFEAINLQAQGVFNSGETGGVLNPVSWVFSLSDSNVKVGDEVELLFSGTIDEGWHLYSSDNTLDPGPIPASFHFNPDDSYKISGEIIPVDAQKMFDSIFDGDVTYFDEKALFRQQVNIKKVPFHITGTLEYQVCSEADGKCIPLEIDFAFGLENAPAIPDVWENKTGLLESRDTYSPYSLLSFMIVAFLAGLAALFTPCVFPMIPMTVTFFTGKSKSRRQGIRNALFYGFSIILIYTLIGSILAPFMGPEMANELATNWIPNVLFFIVFVVFALSFFGMFEITLPSSWVNKVDQKADKGGIAGIFFMAFTLVLVSFSCTGPIVGSILVEAAGGQILKPILGMFAFAMAFAVPFTLFAIFPEWLNSLPKSGGWLNSVKVVLGFLELALALKFLSIADQAYHWGLLDREIYLAAWIVIFSFLGFYLIGKIRLPHDSPTEKIAVPQLILSIIVFTFVAYLIPGMFGAPLKALAGYLPPLSTHDFNLKSHVNPIPGFGSNDSEKMCEKPKYADLLHFPHEIKGYFDYEQALNCARRLNKPLFIDFTGHGCVNCREMEARVWSDPEVLKRLTNDFVMLALYVDDKTQLPQADWYISEYDQKEKRTIGKQNADFQIRKFNNNAQPYYVILDQYEKPLLAPRAYDLSIPAFIDFLDKAKTAYSATQPK